MREIAGRGSRRRASLWLLFVIVGLSAAFLYLATERDEPTVRGPLSLAAALSSDTSGYARALTPRPFRFPADHGPHSDFRTEWWYYTGNLAGPDGRRFAYQFTLFRTALAPQAEPSPQPDQPSPRFTAAARSTAAAPFTAAGRSTAGAPSSSEETWSTHQLYMGHLAVTDVESGEHREFERFSRAAAGLAGARADPYRVWLEDWEVSGLSGADSVRIRAADGDVALDLVLARKKPIVLRGDRGLDQKGPEPGNASFYFSMTRMATTGTIQVDGATYRVEGWSWMDREWSTSALSSDLVGWDWFSLQLNDDLEVMYYRLRRSDGSTSPYSSGSITGPNGDVGTLAADEVQLTVHNTWASRSTGIRYPSRWNLVIPTEQTDLLVEPLVADQELELSIRYWEGAVRVQGTYKGRPVEGFGFVELTGYGEEITL